jgi:hypothetical protein
MFFNPAPPWMVAGKTALPASRLIPVRGHCQASGKQISGRPVFLRHHLHKYLETTMILLQYAIDKKEAVLFYL